MLLKQFETSPPKQKKKMSDVLNGYVMWVRE